MRSAELNTPHIGWHTCDVCNAGLSVWCQEVFTSCVEFVHRHTAHVISSHWPLLTKLAFCSYHLIDPFQVTISTLKWINLKKVVFFLFSFHYLQQHIPVSVHTWCLHLFWHHILMHLVCKIGALHSKEAQRCLVWKLHWSKSKRSVRWLQDGWLKTCP